MSTARRRLAGVLSTALVAAAAAVVVEGSASPASASAAASCDADGTCVETYGPSGGGTQTFTVPDGVTEMSANMSGAAGRSSDRGASGGWGGSVVGTFTVVPGSVLRFYVGEEGGGSTGVGTYLFGPQPTDFSERVVMVAGGGGNASGNLTGGAGGGASEAAAAKGGGEIGGGGGPGTETSGGTGGTNATAGSGPAKLSSDTGGGVSIAPGAGGRGFAFEVTTRVNVDGGDGWYGGGGGSFAGGGGGGSGHVSTAVTLTSTKSGVNNSDGQLSFAWTVPSGPSVSTSSLTDAVYDDATYSQNLTTAGGTAPYTWKVTTGSLPAGLTLSTAGKISGTPTAATATPAAFTVQVSDANKTATKDLTLTVGKAAQTIAFTNTPPLEPKVGTTFDASTTSTGSANPVVVTATGSGCTVSGTTVSFVHTEACEVAAVKAATSNYETAGTTFSPWIAKADQAVAFSSTPPAPATIGETYQPTADGGKSNNPVTFAVSQASTGVCSIPAIDNRTQQARAVSQVTFNHAGTCQITADQAGDDDYTAAPQVTQSITVAKTAQSVAITSTPPGNAAAGPATYTVTTKGSETGNPVTVALDATGNACTIIGTTVSFTRAGTCALIARQAEGPDHTAAVSTVQSFTVAPAPAAGSGQGTSTTTQSAGVADPAKVIIMATVTSTRSISSYGWYRKPVTVTFTCTAPAGAQLTGLCLSPVKINHNSTNKTISRSVTTTTGAITSITVAPINVDKTKPTVKIVTKNGQSRCKATDNRSGVATCTLKRKQTGTGTILVAKATDKAGNRTVRRTPLR